MINLISKQIPVIVDTYLKGMNYIFTTVSKDFLQKLFPPRGFKGYAETPLKKCTKNSSIDSPRLLCILTYMPEIMKQFTIKAERLSENMPSQPISNLVNVLKNETNKLFLLQYYINSQTLCRADYCDRTSCEEKKSLFSKTCDPIYKGLDKANWYDEFTRALIARATQK